MNGHCSNFFLWSKNCDTCHTSFNDDCRHLFPHLWPHAFIVHLKSQPASKAKCSGPYFDGDLIIRSPSYHSMSILFFFHFVFFYLFHLLLFYFLFSFLFLFPTDILCCCSYGVNVKNDDLVYFLEECVILLPAFPFFPIL